jgi:hypothetical protein
MFREKRRKKDYQPAKGQSHSLAEKSGVWVADFGSHELETELREHVLKLKPKGEKEVSWIFSSCLLFLFLVLTEIAWYQWLINSFWSARIIYWLAWLWRLLLLVVWLYLARFVWFLKPAKILAVGLISFTAAVIVSGLLKIFFGAETWLWLNFLVEPVWMILLVVILSSLFLKIKKNN